MGKFNKRKQKIIDILYLERSEEIYNENYNDEYQIIERDRVRVQEMLSDYLKENLSSNKFEIAKEYLESLNAKEESIKSILNHRFYGEGFCDGVKM